MAPGGRLHLKPEVTTIVSDREDVMIRSRIRLGRPHNTSFWVAEGVNSLEFCTVDQLLAAKAERAILLLLDR